MVWPLLSTKATLKDFLEEETCQCVNCLTSPRAFVFD